MSVFQNNCGYICQWGLQMLHGVTMHTNDLQLKQMDDIPLLWTAEEIVFVKLSYGQNYGIKNASETCMDKRGLQPYRCFLLQHSKCYSQTLHWRLIKTKQPDSSFHCLGNNCQPQIEMVFGTLVSLINFHLWFIICH